MEFNVKSILPSFTQHVVLVSKTFGAGGSKFESVLKCKLTKMQEINLWLKYFSYSTNTSWFYRTPSDPPEEGKHLILSADFLCKLAKADGCRAHIKFRITEVQEAERETDPCLIKIVFLHNHPIDDSHKPTMTIPRASIAHKFYSYFHSGMTALGAYKFHSFVKLLEGTEANETSPKEPDVKWVFSLYDHWLSLAHTNPKISEEGPNLHRLLSMRKQEVESGGGSLLYNVSPLSVVLVSGMMKRGLQLVERYIRRGKSGSRVALFVESFSPHSSQETVTIFMASSKIGAIPITVCIHQNKTAADYTQIFERVKGLWAAMKVYDVDFICDDNPALREGLKNNWRKSSIVMPRWLPMQMVWNCAWRVHSNWDRWNTMISGFKSISQAKNRHEAKVCMDQAMNSDVCRNQAVYQELLWYLFSHANEWCDPLLLSSHLQSNFTDLTVRVTKAFLFRSVKYFNLPALLNFFTVVFEKLAQLRIINIVYDLNTDDSLFLQEYPFKETNLVQNHGSASWSVKNQKSEEIRVDPECMMCSCPSGMDGGFCKHLNMACKKSLIIIPFKPALSDFDKVSYLRIAIGDQVPESQVVLPELSSIHVACDLQVSLQTEFTFIQNSNFKRNIDDDKSNSTKRKKISCSEDDEDETEGNQERGLREAQQNWRVTMNHIEQLIGENSDNVTLLDEVSSFVNFMALVNDPSTLESVLNNLNHSIRLLPRIPKCNKLKPRINLSDMVPKVKVKTEHEVN